MKKTLFFILITLSSAAYAQKKEYSSKERDIYQQERLEMFRLRQLPSSEEVLNFSSKYCAISSIEDYSVYVDNLVWRTPYRDSILKVELEEMTDENVDMWQMREPDTLGGIDKFFILKHEKKGRFEAFIYTNTEYTDIVYADLSIWIATSHDNGRSWAHYYTGLYDKQPISLKWYSKVPLIVNEHILQIEAALVKQTDEHSHPIPTENYELVRDGIIVTFDLNTITLDSDNDKLTDIVEEKFRTDPNNPDTNGNGIPDNIDINPKQNVKRTENTVVFEYIIDQLFKLPDMEEIDRIMALPQRLLKKEGRRKWDWIDIPPHEPVLSYASDSMSSVLIITDDPGIMAMQPKHARVIIISSEEFAKTSNSRFKTELDILSLYPMHKVDGKENLYIIHEAYMTSDSTYLVQKTKKGWRIKLLSMGIS